MKRRLAPVALTLVVACTQPYEISRTDVEQVVSTLAADDMAGRGAFSEDIGRAADFIAGEFASSGAVPLEGLEGFRQRFQVYGVTVERATVTIGGEDLLPERLAVALTDERVSWTDGSEARVVRVGADDAPAAAFAALQQAEGDVLVLVHDEHADFFRRVQEFLARGRYRLDPGAGPNVVLALTPNVAAAAFAVEITGALAARELSNVVAQVPGRRADEIVLFSAHYDHLGIQPAVDGDSIANGANDDASGTTAVVALARHFASLGTPERTLVFAAFTAEETGGFGSRHFSEQLDPEKIVAMFNIEMIGKPAVSGANTAWITGFDRSDFGEILQRAVQGTEYSFYADPYPDQNLFYRSDNATLARLGVPAHSISTTPIDVDTDYHQVSDEVATLDLDHMTNTIRAIARAAASIVSGAETPTRVDPTEMD